MGYYDNKGYTEQEKTAQAQVPEKRVEGAYVSPKSEKDLESLQYKKTLFMMLSTLLFAVAIFIPAEIELLPDYIMTYCVVVYLVAMVLSVVVQVLGRNRHKIRSAVSNEHAPRMGYSRFTYMSFEIFVVFHALLVIAQLGVVVFAPDIYTILAVVCMVASLVLAIIARHIFIKANRDMVFVPVQNEEQNKEQQSDKDADSEQTDKNIQDEQPQEGEA